MGKHIGIIGAGFAGLAAALELHDLDYRVTVFEARQRVGGRVWSTTLSNGEITELGGEWISGKDRQISGMIDRLGLSKAEIGVHFLERKIIGGEPVSIDEQWAAREIAAETLAAMQDEDIAKQSLGEFINNLPLKESQRTFFYSRVEMSYGIDINNVALRMIENTVSSFDLSNKRDQRYYRVSSGNMSVAQAVAGRLDDVRLGHAVRLVEYAERNVLIRGVSDGGQFQIELDGVVIAVPVKILAELEFKPPLPKPVEKAITSVEMGTAAKLAVATRERPTLRAYHDAETPYWCWTGKGGDGKVRKVMTAFCGSVQPQKKLATNSNHPVVWFKLLKSENPDLDFEGDPIMVDWSQDKWARGCYSAFSNVATDNMHLLTKPIGNIFFAGEHTANNSATMEGAIESGLRAANQVYEELR